MLRIIRKMEKNLVERKKSRRSFAKGRQIPDVIGVKFMETSQELQKLPYTSTLPWKVKFKCQSCS